MPLPRWIEPQLCKLATKAPSGAQWVHEIKLDGYRMAARIEDGRVKLLTRSGLDWTAKYPATAAAFAKLKVTTAYLDGELCGVRPDGVTSFELMQQGGEGLTYFAFDLLELDGENIARLPLLERKKQLAALLRKPPAGIAYSDHEGGDGEVFRRAACQAWPRRDRLEAARPPVSARRPWGVGQDQMPQPRRVRRRRMVGPGRIATLCRRASRRPAPSGSIS